MRKSEETEEERRRKRKGGRRWKRFNRVERSEENGTSRKGV